MTSCPVHDMICQMKNTAIVISILLLIGVGHNLSQGDYIEAAGGVNIVLLLWVVVNNARRNEREIQSFLEFLFQNKETFSPKLTKIFLERIGLYPKGTFVALNTNEIARVVKQNVNMPSCPIVRVMYSAQGKKTDKARDIDLSQGTKVYITKSL